MFMFSRGAAKESLSYEGVQIALPFAAQIDEASAVA
jgi:hypothetical protein